MTFALELALAALASAPQGGFGIGTPPHLAPQMRHPSDLAVAEFHPYVDHSGTPQRNRIAASGAADFDGDGTPELWFLSDQGPDAGRITVMMGRGSELGRYRNYRGTDHTSGPLPWTDACTYSGNPGGIPTTLFVSPTISEAYELRHWFSATTGSTNPREPQHVNWDFTSTSIVNPTIGIYEIEAADHAGDGVPDIYTLIEFPITQQVTGTLVRHDQLTMPFANAPVDLMLPARCDTLRIADFDGDGNSDCAFHIPGLGVAAFRFTGTQFEFLGGVPIQAADLRDIVIGDADGDGRDNLLIVFDGGVLVYRTLANGRLHYLPEALHNPAGVGSLATAAVVDAYHTPLPEVVVLPRDGMSFAVHPYDTIGGNFTPAVVHRPIDENLYQGSGVQGRAKILADIDVDGDHDLVVQTATGSWFSLFGPEHDFAPYDVSIQGTSVPDQSGFLWDTFTVHLPSGYAASGATQLEVALYEQPASSTSFVMTHSAVHPVSATTHTATFQLGLIQHLLPGPRVHGPTLLTAHLVRDVMTPLNGMAKQRFASKLLWYDGPSGSNGSAVGVRWRLIVTPHLPDVDDDLLPWN